MTNAEFQAKVAANRNPVVEPATYVRRSLTARNATSHVSSEQLDLAMDIFMSRLELAVGL
jgi:hypothetical protein